MTLGRYHELADQAASYIEVRRRAAPELVAATSA